MPRVFVDDLIAGMVLANDLVTPKGRFILAEGATLQANHLKILKSWGITEAIIADGSYIPKTEEPLEINAASNATAEEFLHQKFKAHNLEHEFIAEVYRLAHHQWATRLSQGQTLPVLTEINLPEEVKVNTMSPAQLIRGEVQLASLPNVYTRVVETLNSSRASSSMVADIVSKDSSLSLRLLRLVNSAFYGFPAKIDSISRGITLLGSNELTTLALANFGGTHVPGGAHDRINMEAI